MKYSFIRVLLITLLFSVPLAGCSSFNNFKDRVFKGASQYQVEPAIKSSRYKKTSPSKVKQLKVPRLKAQAPSNNCSYIVRDLSIPNATAVWCMPKVQPR